MIKISEKSGKVGAVFACSGDGVAVANEEVILAAGVESLVNTNVLVSKVTSDDAGNNPITKAYYCTVAGSLVVTDGGTDTVYVTYTYWVAGTFGTAGEIGQVAGFFSWSVNNISDVLETTDYSDVGIRTYIAALKGWEGSAERHFLTEENLDWIGEQLIIKFYIDNDSSPTLRYEGWVIVNSHSVTSAVDSLVNESLSFKGDSVLSYEST